MGGRSGILGRDAEVAGLVKTPLSIAFQLTISALKFSNRNRVPVRSRLELGQAEALDKVVNAHLFEGSSCTGKRDEEVGSGLGESCMSGSKVSCNRSSVCSMP